MENHKPFRLVQNDNTRESWLWFPEEERWHKCSKKEFSALSSFAEILRSSDNPEQTLKDVAKFCANPNDYDY
jgi:hypothetical protein